MNEHLSDHAKHILAGMKRCVAPNCTEEFLNLLAEFIDAYNSEKNAARELELPEVGTVYHNDCDFYYTVSDVLFDGEDCLVALRTMPKISKCVAREALLTMTLGEFKKMNLKRGY